MLEKTVDIVETKIPIRDIKPDMILSKDVVTEDGFVLLAKDTMLNNVNFTKLKSFEISHVSVKVRTINERATSFTDEVYTKERQKVPIESREDFKEFMVSYDEKKEESQKYIRAISDGAAINLEELYALTDGIMNKLKCKSDVFTFISFIKDASEHTFTHSNNVALLANLFSHWIDLPEEDQMYITTAGILHDIGKIKTPFEVLNKKGALTNEEFLIMKQHPVEGYRILQTQNVPDDIKLAALMHHEKIDGTGYPLKITGDKINKLAKIISIVDIYDAMTANRVYRGKICPFDVIKNFETNCYGSLDTEYLWIFLRNIAYSYIGSWVKLSDAREAEVVFINQNNLSRPIVKVDGENIIDLATNKSVSIVSLV